MISRRVPTSSRSLPALALIAITLGAFAARALRIAAEKRYNIDEFQYAHAGWLVAEGQVPYRDFFQHYMPLLYEWLAVPFLFLGPDPAAMRTLRLVAFPIVLWIAYAVYRISARSDGRWGFLAPVFLLSLQAFVTRAVELRPDGLATALFFTSIALLVGERAGSARRVFLAGLLAGASILASQKALFYGLAFVGALSIDLARARAGRRLRPLLSHPGVFCAGAAAALASFALFLTATGAWAGWIEHAWKWSIHHQRNYAGFPWWRTLAPILFENAVVFALSAVGLAVSLSRVAVAARKGEAHPDLLVVLPLASTFASFALTRAPHAYCLIPFLPAVCVFAARGVAFVWNGSTAPRARPVLRAAVVLVLASELVQAYGRLDLATMNRNGEQQQVLERIGALTRPDEPAFDSSGAAVARPHVLFHYYGDYFHLGMRARELETRAPAELIRKGCVLVVIDRRSAYLPPSLRGFLMRNYQPYDGDLRLWGTRYEVGADRRLRGLFHAIRDGRYFVSPSSAASLGQLWIGGRRVDAPIFPLTGGTKSVEYSGPAAEFFVLWLPADGVPYTPRPNLPPRFLAF